MLTKGDGRLAPLVRVRLSVLSHFPGTLLSGSCLLQTPGPPVWRQSLDRPHRLENKPGLFVDRKTLYDAQGNVLLLCKKAPLSLAKWTIRGPGGDVLAKTRTVPGQCIATGAWLEGYGSGRQQRGADSSGCARWACLLCKQSSRCHCCDCRHRHRSCCCHCRRGATPSRRGLGTQRLLHPQSWISTRPPLVQDSLNMAARCLCRRAAAGPPC